MQSGKAIVWRQCLTGIGPFAASYVPAATVAMTINGMLLGENPTNVQMLSIAAISGAASGPFCVIQENIAQNMTIDQHTKISARQVVSGAIRTGGLQSLMRGALVVSLRESILHLYT